MKNTLSFVAGLFAVCSTVMAAQPQQASLLSPDGNLRLEFILDEGAPYYRLDYKGHPVVGESRLGFRLDNSGLFDWFEVADISRSEHDSTWQHCLGRGVRDKGQA